MEILFSYLNVCAGDMEILFSQLNVCAGDMESVSELISGLAPGPEEESPYEALFEATSCQSLDSLASGKSSDRDSGRPDSEAGKVSATLALVAFCQSPH